MQADGKSSNNWKCLNHTAPNHHDLDTQQKLNYANSGEIIRCNHAWPNMGFAQREFST